MLHPQDFCGPAQSKKPTYNCKSNIIDEGSYTPYPGLRNCVSKLVPTCHCLNCGILTFTKHLNAPCINSSYLYLGHPTRQISKIPPPLCPFRVTGQLPSSADQILSRKSAPPLRTTFPEGKNLHVFTSEMCPSRLCCTQIENKQEKIVSSPISVLSLLPPSCRAPNSVSG